MKQKLLILLLALLVTSLVNAQTPVQNQIDDFEDGTTQGWEHGFANANSPTNITTGGPAGIDDNFVWTGNSLIGNKHAMRNQQSNWKGNYTGEGIVAISMDVRNAGVNDLYLRISLRGAANNSWIATNSPVIISTGGGWSTIEIPILASDFILAQNNGDAIADVLLNVNTIKIMSNDGSAPLQGGDTRVQISEYDNIKASTTLLGIKEDRLLNAFTIAPNPGKNRLNIKLSKAYSDTVLEVFDVLGKKIFENRLTDISASVNVSQWNSGVYIVRLTTDKGTQTKRFVKQ